jgi:Histidine phosphatase superfamily (branch 2)
MPIEKSFRIMAGSAAPIILSDKMTVDDLISNLYSGLDHSHSPYAQLTETGSLQLIAVGRELRRRYVGSLLPKSVDEASDLMFCRSSNICRTVQSLRSLLAGMFNGPTGTISGTEMSQNPQPQDHKLPYIFTRHKSSETLFPHADGPCTHMTDRRVKLYHHHLNATTILRWGSLERRMIDFIGTTHRRIGWLTWLNILDIYTCFQAHNIPFPAGLTKSDLESITELVGWTWDVLYAVCALELHSHHHIHESKNVHFIDDIVLQSSRF